MSSILIGKDEQGAETRLNLSMACRHGLIAGATGTGKTATLQLLAEGFSRFGIPVIVPDVKGDLAGIAYPAEVNERIEQRINSLSLKNYQPEGSPAIFWGLNERPGHRLSTTLTEMGPFILGRLLDLNETQNSLLAVIYKIADDQGLLLLDLEDLTSLLQWLETNQSELKGDYGALSKASLATIRRKAVEFGERDGRLLLGEPALELRDMMRYTHEGRGYVNVLDVRDVVHDSRTYSSFLLWLLSELFEELDEVGDQSSPRLVFFFDEAHLLFDDNSKYLLDKIETVVRLIRSKGVGIYFITQSPSDIPDTVLSQLGNRVQHALRAFTPRDQKAVRVAAETMRTNPDFDAKTVITELGIGEALVSLLNDQGIPEVTRRTLIAPPQSKLGAITEDQREAIISRSPLGNNYDRMINRVSAHEILLERRGRMRDLAATNKAASEASTPSEDKQITEKKSVSDSGFSLFSFAQDTLRSMLRTASSQLGREITRGILGSLKGIRRQ